MSGGRGAVFVDGCGLNLFCFRFFLTLGFLYSELLLKFCSCIK